MRPAGADRQSPNFSKSAPHLEKSRAAAAAAAAASATVAAAGSSASTPGSASGYSNRLHAGAKAESLNEILGAADDRRQHQQQQQQRMHHLGKSAEVLTTSNFSASNNSSSSNSHPPHYHDSLDHFGDDDTDNDDDGPVRSGCFPFIRAADAASISGSRHNLQSRSRKKHSLDSAETAGGSSHAASSAGATATANSNAGFSTQFSTSAWEFERRPSVQATAASDATAVADDLTYEPVFYRQMQKSLDCIFSRSAAEDDDDAEVRKQFGHHSRNSRSIGDLASYNPFSIEEDTRPSQFDRDCFFRANQSSFRSTASAASAAAESRKNSVTFRTDHEDGGGGGSGFVSRGGTPQQSPHGSLRSALRGQHNFAQSSSSPDTSHNSSTSSSASTATGLILNGVALNASASAASSSSASSTSTLKASVHGKSPKGRLRLPQSIRKMFSSRSRDRTGSGGSGGHGGGGGGHAGGSKHSNSFYSKQRCDGDLNEQLLAADGGSDAEPSPSSIKYASLVMINGGGGGGGGRRESATRVAEYGGDEEDADPTYERIVRTKHFMLARPND